MRAGAPIGRAASKFEPGSTTTSWRHEGDAQLVADRLARTRVVGARGSRVMIDVVHGDDEPGLESEQQQSERIRPARDGEIDRRRPCRGSGTASSSLVGSCP